MKGLVDRNGALARGLGEIRVQFAVSETFPLDLEVQADIAAERAMSGHSDWTRLQFATLDPKASTDLDQAFAIERSGADLLLHYAIADVGWFMASAKLLDAEAWKRGTTIYMPDKKASLYPDALSEGAASLLPNVERPSVLFTVRIDPNGHASLEGAVRAIIRSAAKLAYETVKPEELPADFAELSRRIEEAEDDRGAMRVDTPQQELVSDDSGRFRLEFRPQLQSEIQNSAMSLAANLAIADALLAHRTGLFRVMPEPDRSAVSRLRHSAKALDLDWPPNATLRQFEASLRTGNPRHAAMQTAIRRASPRASYAPYQQDVIPWHSAMGASYAHATAPLRRLADRYVVEAALAIANGKTVSDELGLSFQRLPPVMARAEEKSAQIERAVLDLAEAVMLEGQEGSRFEAVVTDVDERGARIQLSSPAVVARIDAGGALPGDVVAVELVSVEVARRHVAFALAR